MHEAIDDLVRSLRSGDCVAFVGSGFSGAASLPSWARLLDELSQRQGFDPARRAHVQALLKRQTAHAFDEAAQVIEDTLGRKLFTDELRARLERPAASAAMEQRLAWLYGLPLRAILTTNFDGVLDGETPGGEAFRNILRPEASKPWWQRLFQRDRPRATPVLKIHGDVRRPDTVVITRRDYRRLLYGNPGYSAFLRAVLAKTTVLYLGFSFTDAYLNELRSEILALLGYRGEVPVAYAVINDVPALTCEHYRMHEGIEILTYDTKGHTDFSGFDLLLKQIHDRTNPLFHFGTRLQGKRLLWLDPRPANNDHVTSFFRLAKEVAEVRLDSFAIDLVHTADEALARLAEAAAAATRDPAMRYDLVISHWGMEQTPPTAIALLEGMRRRDLRSPVVIFSRRAEADERKQQALALGAQAYCFRNDGLLRAIDRILCPADETG